MRLLPAKTVKTCLDFLIGSWVKLVLEVKSTGLGQRNVFKWSCFSAAVLKKEERGERERAVLDQLGSEVILVHPFSCWSEPVVLFPAPGTCFFWI